MHARVSACTRTDMHVHQAKTFTATWTDVENCKEEYEDVGPTAGRLEEDNMEEAKLSQKHRVDLELLHGT
ncbi:unnamed protein product [Coccothraustes coccothraustes]